MKYILILAYSLNGHGASIDHIEFPTRVSCETAGKAFVDKLDGFLTSAYFVCVVRP
jgi:hypothetical protein